MQRVVRGRVAGALLTLLVLVQAAGSPGFASNGEAGLERSLLYLQMGLPEMALHELEKAGAAGGALVEALVLQGLLLQAVGRPEQATTILAKAEKEASPGPAILASSAIKAFLGRLLADRGRVEEALQLYREALAADASLGLARLGLAEGLARQGRNEEAIEEYQRFLAENPEDPQALAAVGQLYLVTGRLEDARRSLELALRFDPSLPGVVDALRQLKAAEGGQNRTPQDNG